MVYTAAFVVLNLFLIYCVDAVRISTKLDYGEPASDRAVFTPTIYNDDIRSRANFRNAEADSNVQTVDCVTNFCDTTRIVKSDSKNSASTDVLVHIKTNVAAPIIKNDTVQDIPDIPIIVGTRGNAVSSPDGFPLDPYPVFSSGFDADYPPHSVGFDGIHQPRSHDVNNPRFSGYIPSNNDNPFINPLNGNNRYTPSMSWHPQPRQGSGNVYNPLEFRKVYKNTWPTGFENDWGEFANKRPAENTVPVCTPCICDNQQSQNFPTNPDTHQWNGRSYGN